MILIVNTVSGQRYKEEFKEVPSVIVWLGCERVMTGKPRVFWTLKGPISTLIFLSMGSGGHAKTAIQFHKLTSELRGKKLNTFSFFEILFERPILFVFEKYSLENL